LSSSRFRVDAITRDQRKDREGKPSFDLGFECPEKVGNQLPSKNANPPLAGITPVDLHATSFAIDDGDWDEATLKETCAAVD
jgi:hypothetical protein